MDVVLRSVLLMTFYLEILVVNVVGMVEDDDDVVGDSDVSMSMVLRA
jgi:hypothetical protein